jgi:hypothetical protein
MANTFPRMLIVRWSLRTIFHANQQQRRAQKYDSLDKVDISRDFLGRQMKIDRENKKNHFFKPTSGKITELNVQTLSNPDQTEYWNQIPLSLYPKYADLNPFYYFTKKTRRRVRSAAKASVDSLIRWIWEGKLRAIKSRSCAHHIQAKRVKTKLTAQDPAFHGMSSCGDTSLVVFSCSFWYVISLRFGIHSRLAALVPHDSSRRNEKWGRLRSCQI